MSEHLDPIRLKQLEALVHRVPTIAWDRIPESDQSIESVAEKMISSLPTESIDDPPVVARYTAPGLTAWRGVTRQTVHQQRRAGNILGFTHGRVVVYPAIQFSAIGRTVPVVRDLFAQLPTPLTDAAEVAVWLDTMSPTTGRSQRQLLGTGPASEVRERGAPSLTQVTIIQRAPLHPRTRPSEVGK